ncbi:MAG: FHA domain-containing protein, partial [Atopobiaceae bacterium]|nr:FHA domain-containing protein [Atopobiaceae bacterium]MDD2589095.1 FHA domain-containing protein [Atopobiaceae bacterium]
MIDLVLFVGRIVLVVLLYAFLFAVMKTGIGLV